MFIDQVKISVKGGKGGDGIVSFHREKYIAQGGPDGGDGGRGGSVIFKIDEGKNTLLDYKHRRKFIAPDGENGKTNKMYGKSGEDMILFVPPGTLILDAESGKIIKDMSFPSAEDKNCGEFVIAKGGKGGFGNRRFATPSRQAPNFARNGYKGEEKEIILELKMLADVGLVGYPNVGKSSVLNIISAARPKVANYHFTTLTPSLGVVTSGMDFSFVVADIPGLIEGASEGAGLGHEFLRHIERCRLLLHVVDISGSEGRNPLDDIENINREIFKYSEKMTDYPQIIVANKIDLLPPDYNLKEFEEYVTSIGYDYHYISAATHEGIDSLIEKLVYRLPSLEPIKIYSPEVFEEDVWKVSNTDVDIKVYNGIYTVEADWLYRVVNSVNFDDRESLMYFQRVLRKKGVIEKLEEAGIREGDTVVIYDIDFEFIK